MQTRKLSGRACASAATLVIILSNAAAFAAAAVSVSNAWVRATVPGQSVAGAYLDITANAPVALVAAESPVARKAELHHMTMDGGVMKMRAIEKLELPANRTVNFRPGGYHVMLTGIKRELKAGERVPLRLTVRDRKGVQSTLQVDAEVKSTAGAAREHGHH